MSLKGDGLDSLDDKVIHFWDAVQLMSKLERAGLFTWATGFVSLPPGGFVKLPRQMTLLSKVKHSSNEKQASSSSVSADSSSADSSVNSVEFPEARTCFAQISLPTFKSCEHAKELLLRTVSTLVNERENEERVTIFP